MRSATEVEDGQGPGWGPRARHQGEWGHGFVGFKGAWVLRPDVY